MGLLPIDDETFDSRPTTEQSGVPPSLSNSKTEQWTMKFASALHLRRMASFIPSMRDPCCSGGKYNFHTRQNPTLSDPEAVVLKISPPSCISAALDKTGVHFV
ncbi:hypothetical protein PTI98_004214 [Pleurotus ostreatus]|nr:hypothetical protein PTI98_004214 [Pleurotus ostreatus]